MILAALALAATLPGAEAVALGTRLAESGPLAAMLPTLEAKDIAELVAEHPELDAADQARLRATATATARAAEAKLFAAMGRAYAQALTPDELRAVLAFNASPAARAYHAAEPQAMAAAMQALQGLDFKAATLAAFCAKTKKACPAN